MKKRLSILISIALGSVMLVLFNQNCGQSALQQPGSTGGGNAQKSFPTEPMNLDVNQYPVVSNYRRIDRGVMGYNFYRMSDGKFASSRSALNSSNVCLKPSVLQQLQSILVGATVEPGQGPSGEGIVCTAIYGEPYATLLPLSETDAKPEIRLGERTSGCTTGPDLTQDRAALLRDFVMTFDSARDTESCP